MINLYLEVLLHKHTYTHHNNKYVNRNVHFYHTLVLYIVIYPFQNKKNSEFTFNVPRFPVNKTLSLNFTVQINLFAIKTPTPLTNLKIEEKTLSHTIRLKKEGIAGIPSGIKTQIT